MRVKHTDHGEAVSGTSVTPTIGAEQEVATMSHISAIRDIGRVVLEHRSRRGQVLTQEKLAEALGLSRTKVAYLEEGRELPVSSELSAICRYLDIQEDLWLVGTHPFYLHAMEFEALLSEMIGREASLSALTGIDQFEAVNRIEAIIARGLNEAQAHARFNTLMTVYGERPITLEFFKRYLGVDGFANIESFEKRVRRFQADAMRLYGNFRRAWTRLSRISPLDSELEPLQKVSLEDYESRTPFTSIKEIDSERLPELGYIAVNRIKEQNRDRSDLARHLIEVAEMVDKDGAQSISDLPATRVRRIQTLLRNFDVEGIVLEHGLFARIDPDELRSVAKRIVPEDDDLIRIEDTQRRGLANLSAYLTEPFLDVYVATSMRDDADFVSVNAFATHLFRHPLIEELHLRYFNPTQSWIGDRVSKGLVEALMLRRSRVTVYMAQKGDTFGKDSEASVALGQGKTVIVYVPRLYDESAHLDSEHLYRLDDKALDEELERLGVEPEEGLDKRGKARLVLQVALRRVPDEAIKRIVFEHWADFDLYGELRSIDNENLRKACNEFLRSVRTAASAEEGADPEATVKAEIADRFAAAADAFESRARTFRDVHPLSLQVIVRSGVVNGILVTRSVDTCARVLRGVLENNLKMRVVVEPENYRLVEEETQSTLRVVSRHRLLTNAFWSQYFEDKAKMVDAELLDASTI